MDSQAFEIVPIPATTADELRRTGGEVYVANAVPGYPCRQCLRDAEVGEELILVSHDPFELSSPYRSASPIFIHRTTCESAEPSATIPLQLARRQLSVRSFDAAEMMIRAAVVDGQRLNQIIVDLFGDSSADRLHIHNADRGCWAATVTRAGGRPGDS